MTDSVTTTYVTYLLPGAFFPEESIQPVADRDVQAAAQAAPEGAYAFTFHDQITTTVTAGGEEVRLASDALNKSGRYYIDAEPFTSADVAALPGDHKILLSNMRNDGWDPILRCRTGNWQPLQPGDTVISTA